MAAPAKRMPPNDYLVQNPPLGNQFIGLIHPEGSSLRNDRAQHDRQSIAYQQRSQ
jgi:hypothetical protein